MTKLNQSTVSRPDDWRTCGGEVSHLVRRLRWRHRTHQARGFVAVMFVALVPLALCFSTPVKSFLTSEIELNVASAPCAYYQDEMRAYYCDKSRSDLPTELWEHLATCHDCGRDLVFFGGIAQADGKSHIHANHSALHQQGPKRAVGLLRLFAEGTLAIRH
jgi:hypothetical protein